MYIRVCIHICISLSLSIYIYIYIYILRPCGAVRALRAAMAATAPGGWGPATLVPPLGGPLSLGAFGGAQAFGVSLASRTRSQWCSTTVSKVDYLRYFVDATLPIRQTRNATGRLHSSHRTATQCQPGCCRSNRRVPHHPRTVIRWAQSAKRKTPLRSQSFVLLARHTSCEFGVPYISLMFIQ